MVILLKKKLRIILLLVLIAVFIISTALLVCRLLDNKRSAELYERALDIALGISELPSLSFLYALFWIQLRK